MSIRREENFWGWFSERLSESGLPQRFSVDPATGAYSYPMPRSEREAQIFQRILDGETVRSLDRYYHHP